MPRMAFACVPMLTLLAGLATGACAVAARRGEGLDTTSMPEGAQADYKVFADRCSKCHSLARPLVADIEDPEHWEIYVHRMRRLPGSGITGADAQRILRFLRYYAEEKQRAKRAGSTT